MLVVLDRLGNMLLYCSLIFVDILVFAFICTLPVIFVYFLCSIFIKDEYERNIFKTVLKLAAMKAIIRGLNGRFFRRRR